MTEQPGIDLCRCEHIRAVHDDGGCTLCGCWAFDRAQVTT